MPQLVVEGQEEGELHHDKMGYYELMEGKLMNGRGVWQRRKEAGGVGEDWYLFYATRRCCSKTIGLEPWWCIARSMIRDYDAAPAEP